MRIVYFAMLLLMALSIGAGAQESRNELGFLLGFQSISDTQSAAGADLRFSRSIAYSVSYARHLSIAYSVSYARHLSGENTALFLEVPFAAVPSHTVRSRESGTISSLATLYIVPSLRVRFADRSAVSPWLSGGFGYGLYEGSRILNGGADNPELRNSTATAQFGGGVDVKTPLRILWPISMRAEVRDYYTMNTPAFGTRVTRDGQHNIVVAGGFVLRF